MWNTDYNQAINFKLDSPPLQWLSKVDISIVPESLELGIELKSTDFDQIITATISFVDNILVNKVQIQTWASYYTDDTQSDIILTREWNSHFTFSSEVEKTSIDTLENVMKIIQQRISQAYSEENMNLLFLSNLWKQLEKLRNKLDSNSEDNLV